MPVNYKKLGKRISNFRSERNLSQEAFCEQLNFSREYLSYIENGKRRPSLDLLVDIANSLDVSLDDLLVDSLEHSSSIIGSELHRLLLDCTPKQELILVQTMKALKGILYAEGI